MIAVVFTVFQLKMWNAGSNGYLLFEDKIGSLIRTHGFALTISSVERRAMTRSLQHINTYNFFLCTPVKRKHEADLDAYRRRLKRKCTFENSTMHSSDQDVEAVEAVAPDSGNPDVPELARVEDSSDSAQSETYNDMQTPAN